jgi:hypothetical protein
MCTVKGSAGRNIHYTDKVMQSIRQGPRRVAGPARPLLLPTGPGAAWGRPCDTRHSRSKAGLAWESYHRRLQIPHLWRLKIRFGVKFVTAINPFDVITNENIIFRSEQLIRKIEQALPFCDSTANATTRRWS